MNHKDLNLITTKEKKILELLFRYRGMTAVQLTQLLTNVVNPTSAQKSNTHNYLKRLANKKIVVAKKLDINEGEGSIYYLTSKGLELTKVILNVDEGARGTGYLEDTNCYADLEYGIYKPPIDQLAHHLLFVDTLIVIAMNWDTIEIESRIATYSTRKYDLEGQEYTLRPDGEIRFDLNNETNYFLEIDRGTESYNQLLQKFLNYKRYISTLDSNILPITIFFVTGIVNYEYAIKRRWTTIVSAFLEVFDEDAYKINLIMTPINRLQGSLEVEYNFKGFEKNALIHWRESHLKNNEQIIDVKKSPFLRNAILNASLQINEHRFIKEFIHVGHEYETAIYTNFIYFIKNELKTTSIMSDGKEIKYDGFRQCIYRGNRNSSILLNFSTEKLNSNTINILKLLEDNLTTLDLKEIYLLDD